MLKSIMDLHIDRHINLCRGCPEDNDALTVIDSLECADILAQLLCHIPAVLAFLHVCAVETLREVLVESGLHGDDGLQLVLYGYNILCLEDISVDGCLEGISRIDVPCAEDDVVKVGHWDNLAIVHIFLLCTLADTYLVVLGHGADRLGEPLAGHEYTCHECCGHSTIAYNQNAKFTLGWLYILICHVRYFFIG